MPTETQLRDALNRVMDPELNRSLIELNMVRDLAIDEKGKVSFTLALTIATCPLRARMADAARNSLLALPGVNQVEITFAEMTEEERRAVMSAGRAALPKLTQFNKIGKVVAVMSGKGGVGKSSVTALLAVGLARRGKKVGILDADVTGPSIPKLFGLPAGGLRGGPGGMLPAATPEGIKIVSTNLLLREEDQPVVWRGPMISATIQQFWDETLWGRLDILLVDLPPGTSDPALTVAQHLPLHGVVLVTTPQELSALVVRKALNMLQQLQVPVLAVVENMSTFRCPDNGKVYELFGPSHAGEIAALAGVDVFVRLPVQPDFAVLSDAGDVNRLSMPELEIVLDVLS